MDELEIKPTEAGQIAATKALTAIRNRSFSGRHPELGKMITCQFCDIRHRINERQCQQIFAKRWIVVDGKKVYTEEQLIAGQTPETESIVDARRIRLVLGAKSFKGKRAHPHPNKRTLQFVELVRSFTPNEYTQEDLRKARTRARFILAAKHGRRGFLQPVWQKKEHVH